MQRKLKKALNQGRIDEVGRQIGFILRERVVTSYSLALSLLCALSVLPVRSLADLHRAFVALTGKDIEYKPFHDQLSKEAFPELMREVLCLLIEHLVVDALRPIPGHLLARFTDILLQDGSSMAVDNALREEFPGRFTANRPAAVELHATMSLFKDQAVNITLTPDVDGERTYLPDPAELVAKLLLADRGYFDKHYLWRVDQEGGYFIVRATRRINPTVVSCSVNGRWRRRCEGKKLREVLPLLRGKDADLMVQWTEKGKEMRLRLVLVWNPDPAHDDHMLLVTNLEAELFSVAYVRILYGLRWQVELLFKQWKSHANLHRFPTTKAGIAEGLIWASIGASLLKRFLAHATQHVVPGFQASTHRAAMTLGCHLLHVFEAFLRHPRRIAARLRELVHHLARYAGRAHPQRDIEQGRLLAGLQCACDAEV